MILTLNVHCYEILLYWYSFANLWLFLREMSSRRNDSILENYILFAFQPGILDTDEQSLIQTVVAGETDRACT